MNLTQKGERVILKPRKEEGCCKGGLKNIFTTKNLTNKKPTNRERYGEVGQENRSDSKK